LKFDTPSGVPPCLTIVIDSSVREFEAQFFLAGGRAVDRQHIGEDVELAGIGHAFDTTRRHGVANLREQLVERVVLPVREEAVPLERGSTLRAHKRIVVAAPAAGFERRLATRGLRLGVDAVPDLAAAGLLRGDDRPQRDDHGRGPQQDRNRNAISRVHRVAPDWGQTP
jgi:hypothetical protein